MKPTDKRTSNSTPEHLRRAQETLDALEEEGLVESFVQDGKRLYRLLDFGPIWPGDKPIMWH